MKKEVFGSSHGPNWNLSLTCHQNSLWKPPSSCAFFPLTSPGNRITGFRTGVIIAHSSPYSIFNWQADDAIWRRCCRTDARWNPGNSLLMKSIRGFKLEGRCFDFLQCGKTTCPNFVTVNDPTLLQVCWISASLHDSCITSWDWPSQWHSASGTGAEDLQLENGRTA